MGLPSLVIGKGTNAARPTAKAAGRIYYQTDSTATEPTGWYRDTGAAWEWCGTNINALIEDTTPDGANDYVMTYDASAGLPKKVRLSSLGSSLTVKEADNSPSVTASTIIFPNGTLTDNGGGSVTYTPAAAGGQVPPSLNVKLNSSFI